MMEEKKVYFRFEGEPIQRHLERLGHKRRGVREGERRRGTRRPRGQAAKMAGLYREEKPGEVK